MPRTEPKGALTTWLRQVRAVPAGQQPKAQTANGQTPSSHRLAVYHLSVKPLSRAAGRSATAASAYRAGEKVRDERTGETFDYTAKRGVEHAEIVLPAGAPSWATDREALWNAAEAAEKRKDARVAREYEVAIPKELDRGEAVELMRDFAAELVERYGVAVDVAIHRDREVRWDGSEKGFKALHAHVLTSTRVLGKDGFGEKAHPELSDAKRKSLGLGDGAAEVERVRQLWEVVANRHLERAGYLQRIDCRSLKDQGIEREPTRHLGPAATELERRGERTDLGEVNRRIQAAHELGQEERRQAAALNRGILDLQTSLGEALRQRDELQRRALQEEEQARLRSLSHVPAPPAAGLNSAPVVAPEPKPAAVKHDSSRLLPHEELLDLALYRRIDVPQLSRATVQGTFNELVQGYQRRRMDTLQPLLDKAKGRTQRRLEALDRVEQKRPAQPQGLLAAFKRKAYERDLRAWSRECTRHHGLAKQASRLVDSIAMARTEEKARSWAVDLVKHKQPDLAARHLAIVQEQIAQRWRAELKAQQERDIERARNPSKDRDRGLER